MKTYFINVIAVAIGGALGAVLRFSVDLSLYDSYFPINTIIVNLIGSLILGALTAIYIIKDTREWIKAGLGVGFCGGFTTMSALANDAFVLIENGDILLFTLYLIISVIGGIGLAVLGYVSLMRWKAGDRHEYHFSCNRRSYWSGAKVFTRLFIMSKRRQESLPIAMVVVNLLGALGLGVFVGFYNPGPEPLQSPLYLLFSVGFFGAFTTFSTFSVEAMQLIQKRQFKFVSAYLLISVLGSIILFGLSLAVTVQLT
ncbi:fluoride efflux transporter FluC [Alkalibacillus haloalkaliphilus]|uniref:fluoride efflux transporter FluC n=1 Tax=Alkalibacillus haloalkaliphilus TaxID=94136 RepID=UPI0002F7C0DE|nr:CrcB family protein [Alkalibacillus haloalkaliphilus]